MSMRAAVPVTLTILFLSACDAQPVGVDVEEGPADLTILPTDASGVGSVIELSHVAMATARDLPPQDGTYDVFWPPNLGTVDNNGYQSFRTAFEFDLSQIPAGSRIRRAELVVIVGAWEGPRVLEMHAYQGHGTVTLEDFARDGLVASLTHDAGGPQRFDLEVTDIVGQLAATGATHAGFNLREEPAHTANFLVMKIQLQLGVPRLLIELEPNLEVDIAVKPGGDPSSVHCRADEETIPVAILTTDEFDATTVDHATVTFEGARERHIDGRTGQPRRHEEDVDGDGDVDLVMHVRLGDTGLDCRSTEGSLSGETYDGISVVGTDAVRMLEGGQAARFAWREFDDYCIEGFVWGDVRVCASVSVGVRDNRDGGSDVQIHVRHRQGDNPFDNTTGSGVYGLRLGTATDWGAVTRGLSVSTARRVEEIASDQGDPSTRWELVPEPQGMLIRHTYASAPSRVYGCDLPTSPYPGYRTCERDGYAGWVVFDFSVANAIDLEALTQVSWTSTHDGSFAGIACYVLGPSGLSYGCAPHDSPGPEPGRLLVETETSGGGTDPDGYQVRIDGISIGSAGALQPNDQIDLAMYPRSYDVTLTDLAPDCVIEGEQSVRAEIGPGETVTATFSVTCQPPLPAPVLALKSAEREELGGRWIVRYRLRVENWAEYSDALFALAPDLPPCGPTSAPRTWVYVYRADTDANVNAFCRISPPVHLNGLWVAFPDGTPPPPVYIELHDRLTGRRVRSNVVTLVPPPPAS